MIQGNMSKEINEIIEHDLINELNYTIKQTERIANYDELMCDLYKRINNIVAIYNNLNAIRKSTYYYVQIEAKKEL